MSSHGGDHPNMRFMEPLQRCGEVPDPCTLEVQATQMVAVPWSAS